MKSMIKILVPAFVIATLTACSGTPPTNLGVTDGKLLPCPDKPNCVSSFAAADDETHYIQAISLAASPNPIGVIAEALGQNDSASIVKQENNYLYAVFTSSLMKFEDDVEFYWDGTSNEVQVRSASRLGYSDLGANRDRVEAVRAQVSQ